ncbi:NAD(P)H-binding protein [soil metagenome]
MDVFIIGVTGKVGGLLAKQLLGRGDTVGGLVRTEAQQAELARQRIGSVVGDLATMNVDALAAAFGDADAIVFAAGSNGGSPTVTASIDDEGVALATEAAIRARVDRLVLVSVLPESWRERELGEEVEYYFAAKKRAEVVLTRSEMDWLILRPSLLVDDPGIGTVSLGPAELHDQITRADVAETISALLHEPGIGRQILELNSGSTPIQAAVAAVVARH